MKSKLQVSSLNSCVDSGTVNGERLKEEKGEQIWKGDGEIHLDRIELKTYETFKWAHPGDN